MRLDLGGILSRSLSISWRHKWLWLLGVFGGAAAGNFSYNYSGGGSGPGAAPSSAQAGQWIAGHLALIIAFSLVVLVIVLVAVVISCIAVPASIWAGLQLDAGRDARLGMAWRQGVARFWRYLRLVLLKLLIYLVLFVLAGALVLAGVAVYGFGGRGTLPLLVLGAVALLLAFIVAAVVAGFGLLWSDRMLVLLELGAVDSIRAGWWLAWRTRLDTFVFAVVMWILKVVAGILLFIAALLVSLPGIAVVIAFFATGAGSTLLGIAGFLWVILLGGAAFVVGAGFIGAFNQVAYALAARDLAAGKGLQVRPEVAGWAPGEPPPAAGPSPAVA